MSPLLRIATHRPPGWALDLAHLTTEVATVPELSSTLTPHTMPVVVTETAALSDSSRPHRAKCSSLLAIHRWLAGGYTRVSPTTVHEAPELIERTAVPRPARTPIPIEPRIAMAGMFCAPTLLNVSPLS